MQKKKKESSEMPEEELRQPGLSLLRSQPSRSNRGSSPDLQTTAHLNYSALGELLSGNKRGEKEGKGGREKKKSHFDNCWGSISIKHFLSNLCRKSLNQPWKLSCPAPVCWLDICRLLQNPGKGEGIR